VGHRIALAFDATDFTPPVRENTVAWIRGTPPEFAEIETITTAEIYRRLGLNVPDTATLHDQRTQEPPLGILMAILAGALSGSLAWRRGRAALGRDSETRSGARAGEAGTA
jgi:hypothetical protein